MNTRTRTLTAFLLAGILALFGLAYPMEISADDTATGGITIEGKDGTYATIEAAVKAAEDGDTILLSEGTFEGYRIGAYQSNPKTIVNIKGVEGKTIINGGIHFRLWERDLAESKKSITISGLTFDGNVAEGPYYGQAIRFYGEGAEADNMVSGYTFNIENCSFKDWATAVSVNGSKGIGTTLNVENSTFTNVFCGISAEFTNKFGQDGAVTGDLSGNTFNDTEYAIQPMNMELQYAEGSTRFYDTIESFQNDPNFENPTYNGKGAAPEQWPAAVKNTADAAEHKYYKSLEEALNDATSAEKKLVLRSDVKCEDITVSEGDFLSIDFNGYTLAANIVNNGEAVFSDSVGGGGLADSYTLTNNGDLTVEDDAIAPENIKDNVADQKAAEAVDKLIDAIGPADKITLDSYDAIMAAKKAFEALTAEQQELVTGLDDLNAAIDAYNALVDAQTEDPKDEPSDKPVDKTDKNDGADKGDGKSPQTGDNANPMLILGALLASAGAAVVLRRKHTA